MMSRLNVNRAVFFALGTFFGGYVLNLSRRAIRKVT